ncbi:hypothetical protein SNARM312S_03963 [Streptomyces narbonensis]
MSEHRRKMSPQEPPTGGRAATRRAAQQPVGRRSAPAQDVGMGAPSASYGPSSSHGEEPRPYGGRAEARGPRSAAAVEGVPKPAPGVLVVPRAPVGVGAVAAVVAVAAVRDAAPAVVRRARSE